MIFIVVASLGTLDVAANGHLIELLGYRADYGGAEFSLVTRYYDTVRANAGIGDALAFGYLMTAATVYFLNEIKVRGLGTMALGGAAICTIACLLTLTRGAIAATVLAYVFFLMSPRGLLILFLIFGAALVGITASSQYTDLFLGRFTDSDEGSAYSSELRVIMAEASIDFLANNPVGNLDVHRDFGALCDDQHLQRRDRLNREVADVVDAQRIRPAQTQLTLPIAARAARNRKCHAGFGPRFQQHGLAFALEELAVFVA